MIEENLYMKIITQNKKAYFNYQIEEEISAGIMLLGSEIKSIRDGHISLNEAYVAEIKDEIFLVNCSIKPYKLATIINHEEKRPRKLLIHKKERAKILSKMNLKGYSIVPTKAFFNDRNIVKIMIGLGKGKKLYDKRESIKKRDAKRSAARGED